MKQRKPVQPRHYCIRCGKKKFETYMQIASKAVLKENPRHSNQRDCWICIDCEDENRRYGNNRYY